MMDRWFTDLMSLDWWIIPVVSAVVGALLFGLGGWLLARRKKPVPAPTPAEPVALTDRFDRRGNHRRGGNTVRVEMTDVLWQSPPMQGWVIDRSVGGLCVEVAKPQPIGTVFNVRPANVSAMVPWSQIEVRSCRHEGDHWQLGCQFVHTPPYSILLLFG